jgi:hypothetical protein
MRTIGLMFLLGCAHGSPEAPEDPSPRAHDNVPISTESEPSAAPPIKPAEIVTDKAPTTAEPANPGVCGYGQVCARLSQGVSHSIQDCVCRTPPKCPAGEHIWWVGDAEKGVVGECRSGSPNMLPSAPPSGASGPSGPSGPR